MPLQAHTPGIGFVPEYQASSVPWVTASVAPASGIISYDFPTVTRFVRVRSSTTASGPEVRFGFTLNVTSSNYYALFSGESLELPVRVTRIYIASTPGTPFQVIAGLTGIPARQLPITWVSGTNV
jgi:hypothetical protein